ncbi:MAG TPA: DUF3828 domain-containing protein [Devosiaceae bacterium]|nr:DUF3828 domain-containing protein [Devosiaceae bacterium]
MRGIAIFLSFLLLSVIPALAAAPPHVFDTPMALLEYAYAPYATGNFQDDNQVLYSNALNAMFTAAEANVSDDEVGPVDFDVFVNGQDYQLSDLKIGEAAPEGEGVTVPVTFKNFDEPQSLVFHLVKESGGWKINDIESKTPDQTWRLTDLLKPGADGGPDNSGGATDDTN